MARRPRDASALISCVEPATARVHASAPRGHTTPCALEAPRGGTLSDSHTDRRRVGRPR
eukprot:CAMPEP_0203830782 /NCGR_PEP_ID=MMETSP0115-20131106/66782_1 /ASSEMBLY_ACC=CAM_ASM_000227 /TAXON_ID=33651 /ORGANISM="Bicosoecid sp, Strain ms1" /LENGTH=58 /DNA_ID=CAMNT_0050739845 /DNA_START=77 /DNA_END=250 /DNA_ORIENTATION=-